MNISPSKGPPSSRVRTGGTFLARKLSIPFQTANFNQFMPSFVFQRERDVILATTGETPWSVNLILSTSEN